MNSPSQDKILNTHCPQNDEVDLMHLLVAMLKYKFLILAFLIIGVLSTFLTLSKIEPRYTAQSNILLNFDATSTLAEQLISSVKKGLFNNEKLLTEIEILKSRELASIIVKKLSLTKDKELLKNHIADSDKTTHERIVQRKFRQLSVDKDSLKNVPPEVTDPNMSLTVTNFLESLKVSPIPGSMVLIVKYTSTNPYKASFITNTIVEEYKNLKTLEIITKKNKITKWIDQRLDTLRKNLLGIEAEIEKFKQEKHINIEMPAMMSDRQIAIITAEYNEKKQKQSEIKLQIVQLSNNEASDIITALHSKNINTTLIRDLIRKKINVENEISNFSNRYGSKHPYMIKLNSEIEETNKSIQNEISKSKKVLNQELALINTQINELEEKTNINKNTITKDIKASDVAYLRNLENEAESTRDVLKEFMESYKKYIGSEDIQGQNAQVISYASVPLTPSFPNKPLILSLSALLSLFLGIFFSIILNNIKALPRQ
jgi:uncharacterized protein involved in exopolysaccharide biosynthesis